MLRPLFDATPNAMIDCDIVISAVIVPWPAGDLPRCCVAVPLVTHVGPTMRLLTLGNDGGCSCLAYPYYVQVACLSFLIRKVQQASADAVSGRSQNLSSSRWNSHAG